MILAINLKSLRRHQWRSKKKLNGQREDTRQRTYSNDYSSSIQLDHGNNEIEEANEILLSSNSEISCVCGKVCEGNRGLKSHQRACRTIRGLNRELTNALRSYDYDNEDEITTDILASVSFSPLLIIKSVARVSQHVLFDARLAR